MTTGYIYAKKAMNKKTETATIRTRHFCPHFIFSTMAFPYVTHRTHILSKRSSVVRILVRLPTAKTPPVPLQMKARIS